MGYAPIEDYGVIGNLETCALVGRDGSIDWCCFPHLESSSVFAAILDDDVGGRFRIQPSKSFDANQEYLDATNVLQTHFHTESGTATVTDFMPIRRHLPDKNTVFLLRKVACTEGSVTLDVTFQPRFDYARAETTVQSASSSEKSVNSSDSSASNSDSSADDSDPSANDVNREVSALSQWVHGEGGVLARGNDEHLVLSGPTAFDGATDEGIARATDELSAGETSWYVLRYGESDAEVTGTPADLLDRTVSMWREWVENASGHSKVDGRWADIVTRSALVLKLLTHGPTGSIAAAPTTSLPEKVGGVRNWDYRFSWLRDAALTVQALFDLGHRAEAEDYFEWCLDVVHEGESGDDGQRFFQPLYGLHGTANYGHEEVILDHLEGYRGSSPVRIGNAAKKQRQLDVYGELILGIYETTQYGESIPDDRWSDIENIVEHVCEVWTEPDAGIWEVREEPQQFVHSKVMCWVALDRAIRLARDQGFDDAPIERWREERNAIKDAVLEHGYDEGREAFVESFDSTALDAAVLRMPIVEFLPADDPRVLNTVDAILENLTTDDGLVYRYRTDDGVPGEENPFVLCSFWLVDALVLAGRHEEALDTYEDVVEQASPLGLFAEQLIPGTREHRGNYPQAFSHLGLVNGAIYLQQSAGKPIGPEPVGGETAEESFATSDRTVETDGGSEAGTGDETVETSEADETSVQI